MTVSGSGQPGKLMPKPSKLAKPVKSGNLPIAIGGKAGHKGRVKPNRVGK